MTQQRNGGIDEREVREMAVRWIDSEIGRLKVIRAELVDRPARMSPEREREVRDSIIADRATSQKPHWTQRPENRETVMANVRASATARRHAVAPEPTLQDAIEAQEKVDEKTLRARERAAKARPPDPGAINPPRQRANDKPVNGKKTGLDIARGVFQMAKAPLSTHEALARAKDAGWTTKGDERSVWSQTLVHLRQDKAIRPVKKGSGGTPGTWERVG